MTRPTNSASQQKLPDICPQSIGLLLGLILQFVFWIDLSRAQDTSLAPVITPESSFISKDNISNNAKVIEVSTTSFGAKVFLESDSNRLNVITIPEWFKDGVGKAQNH